MDFVLIPLADLLRLYINEIDQAISSKSFLDQAQLLAYPLIFLGMIYSSIKFWWLRVSQHDEKLHEKKRIAENLLEKSKDELKKARMRNDELLRYDPEIFIAELDKISRDKVIGVWQTFPAEWLNPLRPALARAYASLAKEMVLDASTTDDLDDALNHARGAIAADPLDPAHKELVAEIKEARDILSFEGLSEHEIAALKLPRVKNEPSALIEAGSSMYTQGKYKVARLFFGRAWELAEINGLSTDAIRLGAQSWYASTLSKLGHYGAAEKEFRAILEIQRRPDVLGEEHPDTLTTRFNLANEINDRGDYDAAEKEYRAILEIQRRPDVLGEEHPDTLTTRSNLAYQIGNRGDYGAAEKEFRAILEIQRRPDVLGEEHPDTLTTRFNLANEINDRGDYDAAEKEYRAILEIQRRPDVLGEEHPDTLTTRSNLAYQIGNRGDYGAAEKEFRAILEIQRRPDVLGEEHPRTLRTRYWLAKILVDQSKSDQSWEILNGLMELMKLHLHPEHKWITDLKNLLEELPSQTAVNTNTTADTEPE